MHFNFHLSGDESPEQTRRIANAVLALGGLLVPSKSVGEITVDVKLDTSQAVEAIRDLVSQIDHEPEIELTDEERAERLAKYEEFGGEITIAERKPIIPSTPPPAPPVQAAATTDKNGLPWDERIHSGSRAINADGTWRYRKNVSEDLKSAVEAELRSFIEPQDHEDSAARIEGGAVVTSIAPPVPPIPAAPPPPPVPPSSVQRAYSDVVNLIMSNRTKLTPEVYVAVIGSDLPSFAKTCMADPNAATVAFNTLDEIRRA